MNQQVFPRAFRQVNRRQCRRLIRQGNQVGNPAAAQHLNHLHSPVVNPVLFPQVSLQDSRLQIRQASLLRTLAALLVVSLLRCRPVCQRLYRADNLRNSPLVNPLNGPLNSRLVCRLHSHRPALLASLLSSHLVVPLVCLPTYLPVTLH